MKQLVVFLRGINVGGRKIMMAELKSCLEAAGFQSVQTVLQTGNVILGAEGNEGAVQTRIETALSATFSYPARVLVVSAERLQRILRDFSFSGLNEIYHRYLIFTEAGLAPDIVSGAPELKKEMEGISTGDDVVYWYVQKGMTLESDFGKYINKISSKCLLTTRNANTVEKILAKCK